MTTEHQDDEQRFALGIVGIIVGLIISTIVGFCIYWGMNSGSNATDTKAHAANTTHADAAHTNQAAVISDKEASVVVEDGVVKFYFASGKADLAGNANDALKDVIAGLKAGKKATISGYHDSTGDLKTNEALSKQRAESVYNSLLALGINQDLIEMKKPESAQGTGNDAQARRVEVVLQK